MAVRRLDCPVIVYFSRGHATWESLLVAKFDIFDVPDEVLCASNTRYGRFGWEFQERQMTDFARVLSKQIQGNNRVCESIQESIFDRSKCFVYV